MMIRDVHPALWEGMWFVKRTFEVPDGPHRPGLGVRCVFVPRDWPMRS